LNARCGGSWPADNFYWLSIKPDVLDEEKSEWFVRRTIVRRFHRAQPLPEAQVQAETSFTASTNGMMPRSPWQTPQTLAFFIEMRIVAQNRNRPCCRFSGATIMFAPPRQENLSSAYPLSGGEEPEPVAGWNVNSNHHQKQLT